MIALSGEGPLLDLSRYDEALADYNRAIELDPSEDDYAAKQAEIPQLMGKWGEAPPELSGLELPSEG